MGLTLSVERLSRFEENREHMRVSFPDEKLKELPVSVIVPAHNEESCICDTVDSLLNEQYPGLEILVVDDGSEDRTAKQLIERYRMRPEEHKAPQRIASRPVQRRYIRRLRDKTLVLLCKENGGKADALNCGLNACTGSHCVVVDADTQITAGALRIMAGHFAEEPDTIVCAGAVGTLLYHGGQYKALPLYRKLLVLFQHMEYYRTFYMQRLLFDRCNANVIVSGAFAMFDRELVLRAGGYRTDTIGEDMELTMRLHAFCLSQHRPYQIVYAPEARCDTQVPFRYRDYCRQRRRWHIGMIQSLKQHLYMIGNHYYGWVGILSVGFTLLYELCAPVIEVLGLVILLLSAGLGMLDLHFALSITAGYLLLSLLTQGVLLSALDTYGVEPIPLKRHVLLILTAATELFLFHPVNLFIKLATIVTYHKHQQTWTHIRRIHEEKA